MPLVDECILIIEVEVARIKSQDKRNAILGAATKVFAERGLSAATSAISAAAGIAEGTLFTYFTTKDELVNALYREIKLELADAMMSAFPRKKSVRSRLQHIWNQYIEWGLKNPMQQGVLRQVLVWNGLTQESKKAGSAPFLEIESMIEEAERQRIVQDLPRPFIEMTLVALADTVMELVRQDAKRAGIYCAAGFEMLWGGIARKQ
jgi:AcrR family transcriptional regulator